MRTLVVLLTILFGFSVAYAVKTLQPNVKDMTALTVVYKKGTTMNTVLNSQAILLGNELGVDTTINTTNNTVLAGNTVVSTCKTSKADSSISCDSGPDAIHLLFG